MISRSILAFEFVEYHHWLLLWVHGPRENEFSSRSRVLCNGLRWVDREDIYLDLKPGEVVLQNNVCAVGEPQSNANGEKLV